jgi:archaellum component FlaC
MVMIGLSVFIVWRMPVPQNAPFLTTQDDWSLFAEVFGSIGGTLFAGLAFAGLIWTIRVQQRELKETRKELAEATKAQVKSQKAHEAHVKVAQQSARLSAATALLNHYEAQIPKLEKKMSLGMGGGPEVRERLTKVLKEVDTLETEIQDLRDELKVLIRHVDITSEAPPAGASVTVTTESP